MLENSGYTVLEAPDSDVALTIARRYPGPLDAMVTDLVMPKMDGRTLAAALASIRPSTRVVFTSGYTDDALIRRGLVDSQQAFLQKPFTDDQLASTINGLIGR